MIDKIDELLEHDGRARWRMILLTAAGVALWGIWAQGLEPVTSAALLRIQIQAGIIGIALLSAQVLLYCVRQASTVQPTWFEERVLGRGDNRYWRLASILGIAAVAALVVSFSGPRLQTKILDSRIIRIPPTDADRRLASVALYPRLGLQQLTEANAIVESARRNQVPIAPGTLAAIGSRLTTSSGSSDKTLASEAWRSAVNVIDYRTTLNQSAAVFPRDEIHEIRSIHPFLFRLAIGGELGQSVALGDRLRFLRSVGDDVPIASAARLEPLGSDANKQYDYGPRLLVLELPPQGSLSIDGTWMKNVVVRNTHVVYGGGPVRLDNVVFVDCDFKMDNTVSARELGNAIAAATAVSFASAKIS
ncbi:MAG TPA: hypothetical protein VKG25_04020 [Bryobacteraceae bacterium]|nr:hypothetical protein [Bryobacteraceae bacterium]